MSRLSKGARVISWFLIHVFLLQVIPFSAFAKSSEGVILTTSSIGVLKSKNAKSLLKTLVSNLRRLESEKSISRKFEKATSIPNTNSEVIHLNNAISSGGGGFTPGTMNDMVDPFTGDFKYSIPLMDVEGYPLTLTYNSNVKMTDEATWVGLGWNLDVGSITREMRGIPDEFNGDQSITNTYKVKKDETNDGFKAGGYLKVSTSFGGDNLMVIPSLQLTALWGKYKNTYLGLGKTFDIGLQAAVSLSYADEQGNTGFNFGIGYSSDSKGGVGFNKSFGLSQGFGPKSTTEKGPRASIGLSYGTNFNSRMGMVSQNFGYNISAGYQTSKYVADSKDKRNGHSGSGSDISYGASTSITYGTAVLPPRLVRNTSSESDAFFTDIYVGFKLKPVVMKVGAILETYSSSRDLSGASVVAQPAYGYFHSGKRAGGSSGSVSDFDRGTDFPFSQRMKNLPFSVQAFDLFHVNSSVLNAQFRGNRTDVGTYYDARVDNKLNENSEVLINDDMKGINVGVLLGAGITIELGYSTGVQQGQTTSGYFGSNTTFNTVSAGQTFDPTLYFKAVGEPTPTNMNNYDLFGGKNPRCFSIDKVDRDYSLTNVLDNGNSVYSSNVDNSIPIRSTAFIPSIVSDLLVSPDDVNKKTFYYNPSSNVRQQELRNVSPRAGNHLSSINVVSTSGSVYTYGLPVYNIISSDVSFSVDNSRTYDDNRGEVSYVSGDDGTGNTLGKAEMFSRTDVPAYPSSFLLTSLVSADYVDLTHDGNTVDDIGMYYKFDYYKYFSSSSPFKWRFPVSGNSGSPKAILNKGFLSLNSDDNATYSYTEQEIYYPRSISGKNSIAVFELVNREDGRSVSGPEGFLESSANKSLQRLAKIKLYNLLEYNQNPATAVPIQVVEFMYNYSLCPNAPNNPATYTSPGSAGSGKLTLIGIRSYSGSSKELGLSETKFTYDQSNNKPYNPLNVDRWGNYKENNTNLPNNLYPAAIQDPLIANQNIQAWKLTKITTPTGAEIVIAYEADSYGYVQTKRAMHHYQIEGMMNLERFYNITNSGWSNPSQDLSNEFRTDNYGPDNAMFNNSFRNKYGKLEENFLPNNVIVFKLENPINGSLTKDEANKLVKEQYFRDPTAAGSNAYLRKLYFNVFAEVKSGYQEMIPCMVDIAPDYSDLFQYGGQQDLVSIGAMPMVSGNVNYQYGYVVLELINVGMIEETKKKKKDKDILVMHPIQRFGVDFIRQNLPDIVYGACESCTSELSIDKKALFGKEMYKYIIDQGSYLRNITLSRSFVRLFDADNHKIGGNARVSSIQLNDKWGSMSSEGPTSDGTYGWSYSYPEMSNNQGVASYEPMHGMDENPFYSWDSYYNFAKKFPDELNFNITPVAMQLFPVPVVGYKQVKVRMTGLGETSKGQMVYNFHTSNEYAYRTTAETTGLNSSDPVKVRSFLKGKTIDKFAFSQGYSVTTNDFHGKIMDVTLEDQNQNPISKTQYTYYQPGEPLPMINRTGNVTSEHVSLEYDIHMDSRFIENSAEFQMAGLTVGFTFPTFKVSIGPYYTRSSSERGFYSHCLIKHLNYSAIVKEVKTTYLGSSNTARNELYDRHTGNVLLSSLQDEYNDRLYSLSYPAHWAYPVLRELQTTFPSISYGVVGANGLMTTTSDMGAFYSPGDLIEISNGSLTVNGYVLSINPTSGGSNAYITDINGAAFSSITGAVSFVIKKTNRSNRLDETMQGIVTKTPFLFTVGNPFPFPSSPTNDKVISSSAIRYKDKNNLSECSPKAEGQFVNLFASGAKGDPVIETVFSWQSERVHEVDAHKTRFDGSYSEYKSFYAKNANNVWVAIDHPTHPFTSNGSFSNWRKNGIPTRFSKAGVLTEYRDPIGVYSAQVLMSNGYVQDLPIAQVVNANLTDVAFDGFEPYTYNSYGNYFSFGTINANKISTTTRHSGKTSLQLNLGQFVNYIVKTEPNCSPEQKPSTDIPQSYMQGNNNCNCPPPLFNPSEGEYVMGAWVKQTGTGASVKIILGTGPNPLSYTCQNVGPVIDGWQRVEAVFNIPQAPIDLELKIENTGSSPAYIDDFRIHPFNAIMTSTVYDASTFLPMATHDANNFSTFYNYDENLQMVRVKVETIEGIKTVSETETSLSTKNGN